MQIKNFITKGLQTDEGEKRIIKGHVTSDAIDKQGEVMVVDDVMRAMGPYFKLNPAIIDHHSNRTVGKALSYKKSEIEGHPSIYIEAEIYKDADVQLYDVVWDRLVKGDYKGFSLGGLTREKEPIVKDGRLVMMLKSIEVYEISVCPSGSNPFAVIDYVSPMAKASGLDIRKREDGMEYLQCEGVVCELEKAEPEEVVRLEKAGGEWKWVYCQEGVKKADEEIIRKMVLEKFAGPDAGGTLENENKQSTTKTGGDGKKQNDLKTEDGMIKSLAYKLELEKMRTIQL